MSSHMHHDLVAKSLHQQEEASSSRGGGGGDDDDDDDDDHVDAVVASEPPPSEQHGEMDRVSINLLQFRAQQSLRSLNATTNNAFANSLSVVDELRSSSSHHHHHRRQRSSVPNAHTDDGDDRPCLPTRRSSHTTTTTERTVSTLEDVKNLVSNEFLTSNMPDRSGEMPRFRMEEIVLGKTLGSGAFGVVTEIVRLVLEPSSTTNNSTFNSTNNSTGMMKRSVSPASDQAIDSDNNDNNSSSDDEDEIDDDEDEDDSLFDAEEAYTRKILADHCRRSDGYPRFAIKKLRSDIVLQEDPDDDDENRMLQGISDLARETFFLKRIRHPNIIRLRAVSYTSEFDENYFLVLDRLHDTLPSLLEVWRKERKKSNGLFGLFLGHRRRRRSRSRKDKLKDNIVTVCFELSSALTHLHRNDIIYRDLKPANVGFDFKGDLKLFDFGLAKEIPVTEPVMTAADKDGDNNNNNHSNNNKDGLYHLTQMCGTPRYMAPEVANGSLYGPSCDVYSFALLCWQMAALKRPYDKCGLADLERCVWMYPHQRPTIRQVWPLYFRQMLTRCWSNNVSVRLTMPEIESILAEQVAMFNEDFDLDQHLVPRRSTLAVVGDLRPFLTKYDEDE